MNDDRTQYHHGEMHAAGATIECLPTLGDPLAVAARWPEDQPLLMLHSGRLHPQWARWSILTTGLATYRFGSDGRSRWAGEPPDFAGRLIFTHDPLIDLNLITQITRLKGVPDDHDGDPSRPPFHGGWVGWLSYDLGGWIEPRARLHARPIESGDWPLIELAHCPTALIYDHLQDQWIGVGAWQPLVDGLRDKPLKRRFELGEVLPTLAPEHYQLLVDRVKTYIAAGDIYQANIAQRFQATIEGSVRALALRALGRSQPWYGAHLEFGDASGASRRSLISMSPELFLSVDPRTREIVTRPIKGTRPATAEARDLDRSIKDAAELHMIVDLMRNDLGRVCEFGSVNVPHARMIETHPTVHHGVGEVVGTLRCDATLRDVIGATFPGGSVTGAPKIRAMQIIEELEDQPRGPYCGSIGFISDSGALRLNIAIRTMLIHGTAEDLTRPDVLERGTLEYWAGAGIVADSIARAEHQESLDKTAVLHQLGEPASRTEFNTREVSPSGEV